MGITNTSRIAKNTLFLYFRMIVIMLVSLYTSRIVLNELGVDDYGVYMVVGGVVSMFAFLNTCMTSTTQRFLNYEMGASGETAYKGLKRIFANSLSIHLVLAGIVLILAETVGLWFVNYRLVIPEKSLYAANIVYQTSILCFLFNIFRAPFNASMIAHERMRIFAVLSVAEAFLILGSALLLKVVRDDKLAAYGCMYLCVVGMIAAMYVAYCLRSFKECSLKPGYDRRTFKEMFSFAGWNMFGSLAWVFRMQGVGILLNVFFGPVLNAAKGIADQVYNAVNSLTGNFMMALNPQITKSYASGECREMEVLVYRGLKFSGLLIWCIALPVMINVNLVLSVWLKEVPEFTPVFVQLMLVDCLVSCIFGVPLTSAISATGNIRSFRIWESVIYLAVFPAGYFAFKAGYAPESIMYLNILFNLFAGIMRYGFCIRLVGFKLMMFLRKVIVPLLLVFMVSSFASVLAKHYLVQFCHNAGVVSQLLIYFGIAFVLTILSICYIGMDKAERTAVFRLFKTRLPLSK